MEAQIVYENEKNKYFPLADPFRYQRNSFWSAGLDTISTPPTQNPDTFMKLDNVLPVTKGTIQRRWGYNVFGTLPFSATRLVEYQSDETSVRRILLADATTIASKNEDGTDDNNSIATITATPRIVVSRDWAFVVNGQSSDLKKLGDASGTWQVENWGIVAPIGTGTGGDQTKYAGTVVQTSDTYWDVGTSENWSNPTHAEGAPDGSYAEITWPAFSASGRGHSLDCTNYGFTLDTTTVIGSIAVTITGYASAEPSGFRPKIYLNLLVGGVRAGSIQVTLPDLSTTSGAVTLTASVAAWGVSSLTATQVNDSGFGVQVIPVNLDGGAVDMFIDSVQIEVQAGGGGALTVGTPVGGSITLSVGRIYYYVYRNSSTGHISGLSDPSVSTGPLSTKSVPLSNIIASTDTQVDFVDILATADGGDETTLYYVGSVANGTTTFSDDVDEDTLLLNNTYLETDQYGNEIGVADNTPPPTAAIGIKHRGRIYLANGQYLYFSKSLGEVTTSTGLIAGRYEEAWPADYVLDISAGAESIRGLLSDGMILYIGTERHVRRLIGDGPLNFTKPDVTFAEVGVLNQEVWKVVYHEGMPTGVIWLTPDFRVIWSDFNTYRDISPPIQGSAFTSGYLNSINQSAAVAACRAEIFTSGPYDFYFLLIPTGSNTIADTILVFNIKTQQWFRWLTPEKINSILFNVTAAGVPQLIFASDDSDWHRFGTGIAGVPLLTQDFPGGVATNITTTVQTSWLDLGDSGMRKSLNNLDVGTADTALTVNIEAASTLQDFASPPTIISGRGLTSNAYSDYRMFPIGNKFRKHFYRYTFNSSSQDVEVLDRFAQEVFPVHKF